MIVSEVKCIYCSDSGNVSEKIAQEQNLTPEIVDAVLSWANVPWREPRLHPASCINQLVKLCTSIAVQDSEVGDMIAFRHCVTGNRKV